MKVQMLIPGQYFHVFNRGINGEDIFLEPQNYAYFLDLYQKYISPIAETYAYCLLVNHFHFLIRNQGREKPSRFSKPGRF